MDVNELIDNLRMPSWHDLEDPDATLLGDAADALSSLQAENESLKEKLYDGEGVNLVDYWMQQAKIEENGHRNCQAENEKLRAELEQVKVERDAYQAYFKDLSSKPDCNTCEKRNCDYRPKLGATVRANCPLYSGPQKED